MTRTSTRITFGLYALDVKQDSSLSTPADLQPFSKILDLRTDSATNRPYATWEPDFWLLDGQYKFLPADTSNVHVGLVSLAMSDSDGAFADPPVLTIEFGQVHSIDSLSLRFATYSNNYASALTVAYYDADDVQICTDDYTPDSAEFTTGKAVEDFKKIMITFSSTNRPFRYLRLTGIDYGEMLTLEGSVIKSASVIEELDQLSAEVRFDTLEMRLSSTDGDFNILNPVGYYSALKEGQPMAVYELVDNQVVYIGQYYLDEWSNTSDTEIEFRCVDRLGILDQMTCRGGIWSGAGISAADLIELLLGAIYMPYELDSSLAVETVIGWLPICTYREALQQIAFAIGASVGCSRSGVVKIQATKIAADESPSVTITRDQMGSGSISLLPQVTGVEVTAHNYLSTSTSRELYNGALGAGSHEIVFSEPMHDLSVSGATITESGANYAILNVVTPGTVTLSGQTYNDTTRVFGVYSPPSPSLVQNILQVQDATLVNSANGATVADRIYNYHQQRYAKKLKLYVPAVEVGDVVLVDTLYGRKLRGVIEKMSVDLSGGFVAKVELTGVDNA